MSKTPDEIVKALKCCGANLPCDYCPYFDECACDCMSSLNNAAAALIESLQSQLAEREREIERMREIIGGIVALASQGESVTLTEDLGENTLTICVGSAHTHCGVPDGSLDTLIDHLHALLVDGVGLSWATAAPEEGKQI